MGKQLASPSPLPVAGFLHLSVSSVRCVMIQEPRKPTKWAMREYLDRRAHSEDPPPSIEEIRRELGWDLLDKERQYRIERND